MMRGARSGLTRPQGFVLATIVILYVLYPSCGAHSAQPGVVKPGVVQVTFSHDMRSPKGDTCMPIELRLDAKAPLHVQQPPPSPAGQCGCQGPPPGSQMGAGPHGPTFEIPGAVFQATFMTVGSRQMIGAHSSIVTFVMFFIMLCIFMFFFTEVCTKSRAMKKSFQLLCAVAKQWAGELCDIFIVFPWKGVRFVLRYLFIVPLQALHGAGFAARSARKLRLQRQLLEETDAQGEQQKVGKTRSDKSGASLSRQPSNKEKGDKGLRRRVITPTSGAGSPTPAVVVPGSGSPSGGGDSSSTIMQTPVRKKITATEPPRIIPAAESVAREPPPPPKEPERKEAPTPAPPSPPAPPAPPPKVVAAPVTIAGGSSLKATTAVARQAAAPAKETQAPDAQVSAAPKEPAPAAPKEPPPAAPKEPAPAPTPALDAQAAPPSSPVPDSTTQGEQAVATRRKEIAPSTAQETETKELGVEGKHTSSTAATASAVPAAPAAPAATVRPEKEPTPEVPRSEAPKEPIQQKEEKEKEAEKAKPEWTPAHKARERKEKSKGATDEPTTENTPKPQSATSASKGGDARQGPQQNSPKATIATPTVQKVEAVPRTELRVEQGSGSSKDVRSSRPNVAAVARPPTAAPVAPPVAPKAAPVVPATTSAKSSPVRPQQLPPPPPQAFVAPAAPVQQGPSTTKTNSDGSDKQTPRPPPPPPKSGGARAKALPEVTPPSATTASAVAQSPATTMPELDAETLPSMPFDHWPQDDSPPRVEPPDQPPPPPPPKLLATASSTTKTTDNSSASAPANTSSKPSTKTSTNSSANASASASANASGNAAADSTADTTATSATPITSANISATQGETQKKRLPRNLGPPPAGPAPLPPAAPRGPPGLTTDADFAQALSASAFGAIGPPPVLADVGWDTGGTGSTLDFAETVLRMMSEKSSHDQAPWSDSPQYVSPSFVDGTESDSRPEASAPLATDEMDRELEAMVEGLAGDCDILDSRDMQVHTSAGGSAIDLLEDAFSKVDAAREALSKVVSEATDGGLRDSAPVFVPGQMWTGSQRSCFVD